MTETKRPSVEDVAARAAQVTPGKFVAGVLMAAMITLGYMLGSVWFLIAFAGLWLAKSFTWGFLKGSHADKRPRSQ